MDSSGFHKKYFDSCVNFAHFTSLLVALFNCDSLLDGNRIIVGIICCQKVEMVYWRAKRAPTNEYH